MSIQVQTSSGETQEFFSVGEILILRNENATLRARVASLEAALSEIRTHYGKVCNEFETCQHPACTSSYSAWAVADEALRAQVSP